MPPLGKLSGKWAQAVLDSPDVPRFSKQANLDAFASRPLREILGDLDMPLE